MVPLSPKVSLAGDSASPKDCSPSVSGRGRMIEFFRADSVPGVVYTPEVPRN